MSQPSKILVTGGAGYIGSHTLVELLAAGHEVVVADNLSNSKITSLSRVEEIAQRKIAAFYEIDVRDRAALDRLFTEHAIDCVIHFAALKAVGESVAQPLRYYENNLSGTITLMQAMSAAGVTRLVFSSSATVYGDAQSVPILESFPIEPTNPYGRSKAMMEGILRDAAAADARWQIALLRYFNPVGAHESGRIGEDPNGLPNNLLPYVSQVAVGKLRELRIFGDDYATPDGTGVRDYIHVVDLAKGHVKAVQRLQSAQGVLTVNLGSGRGYSVLEVVRAFEKASGKKVPYQIAPRREGDIAQCWADPALAEKELGWKTDCDIDKICEDTWRWQAANPNGYE